MVQIHSKESSHSRSRADDWFFVATTLILPVIAEGAYIFDVYHFHTRGIESNGYEGLLSSILSVFIYLQYCVPLRSRYARLVYHTFLWMLNQTGTLAHVIYYSRENDIFHMILYIAWIVIDTIYFGCLLYCRVLYKHHGLRVHIPLEQEYLFHFISRLEVIFGLFIPVFFNEELTTLTRDNIAFYILFDFFAQSYHRFRGTTIKATLYLFVIVVTASVATEWIYVATHKKRFDKASVLCEIVAACFCYAFILMQFFPGNFLHKKKDTNDRREKSLTIGSSIATEHTYAYHEDTRISYDDIGQSNSGDDVNRHITYF